MFRLKYKNPSSGDIKMPNKSYYTSISDIQTLFTLIRIVDISSLQFS